MQWFPRVSLLAPSLLWSGPCGLFPQKYCLIISLYSGRKIHCSPLIKNKVQTPLQASLRQTFICLSVLPPTRPPHKPSTPTHALQVWWKESGTFCRGHAAWDLPHPWQPRRNNLQNTFISWCLFSEWGMSIRQANAKAGSSNWTYCLATLIRSRSSETGHLQESTVIS